MKNASKASKVEVVIGSALSKGWRFGSEAFRVGHFLTLLWRNQGDWYKYVPPQSEWSAAFVLLRMLNKMQIRRRVFWASKRFLNDKNQPDIGKILWLFPQRLQGNFACLLHVISKHFQGVTTERYVVFLLFCIHFRGGLCRSLRYFTVFSDNLPQ